MVDRDHDRDRDQHHVPERELYRLEDTWACPYLEPYLEPFHRVGSNLGDLLVSPFHREACNQEASFHRVAYNQEAYHLVPYLACLADRNLGVAFHSLGEAYHLGEGSPEAFPGEGSLEEAYHLGVGNLEGAYLEEGSREVHHLEVGSSLGVHREDILTFLVIFI